MAPVGDKGNNIVTEGLPYRGLRGNDETDPINRELVAWNSMKTKCVKECEEDCKNGGDRKLVGWNSIKAAWCVHKCCKDNCE